MLAPGRSPTHMKCFSVSPLEKTDAQILYASGRELPEMVIQADRPPEVRL